jgi:hypothetical protein
LSAFFEILLIEKNRDDARLAITDFGFWLNVRALTNTGEYAL